MSASLVGSEMCIRDSKTKAAAAYPTKLCRALAKAIVARGRRRPPSLNGGCLLYTSDAADDM
eukprot:4439871-Alexandrium_andersonii.AAC.1